MGSNSNRRSSSSVSGNRTGAHARPSGPGGASGPSIPYVTDPRDEAPANSHSRYDFAESDGGPAPEGGRRRRGRHRGKIRALIIAVVVVIIAAGVAWGVLGHTDVFKITSIDVKNTSRLSDTYLTALVDIPEGTNLMNIDTNDVKQRLTDNPWIEKVSVHRSFPHTLSLDIEESMPTAVVQVDPASAIGATEFWFISGDGVWMSQVSSSGVEQAQDIVRESTGQEDLYASIDEEPVVDDPQVDTDGDGVPDASADFVDEDEDGYDDNTGEPIGQTTVAHEDEDQDGYDDYTNEWIGTPEEESSDDSGDSADEASGEAADDATAAADAEATQANEKPSVCADAYVTVEELAQIPVVSGVSIGVQPETGKTETDEGVINALNILEGADEEFEAQIASITSATGDSTDIMLKNGIEVAFGPATDIQSKIRIIEQLIEDHPDSIAYINVRVVSRPSWRGW